MAESMMERGAGRERLARRGGATLLLLGIRALGAVNSVSCAAIPSKEGLINGLPLIFSADK